MVTITTRPCMICQQASTIAANELQAAAYAHGLPVQDIWPHMPRAEREVLISGIHPDCWAGLFGPDDD